MQRLARTILLAAAAIVAASFVAPLGPSPASAQGVEKRAAKKQLRRARATVKPNTPKRRKARRAAAKNAQRYFIEFRSRRGFAYRHALVYYGHTAMARPHVAGLYPVGGVGVLGHFVSVPGSTAPMKEDYDERLVLARYRVALDDPEQATRIFDYIDNLKRNSNRWHAANNNCIGFVESVARYMGLRAPRQSLTLSAVDWVRGVAAMNGPAPAIRLATR